MALKAAHTIGGGASLNLGSVTKNASVSLCATRFSSKGGGFEVERSTSFKFPKFLVVGHRGNGMNRLQSSEDRRMKTVKENSILSFNTAASFPLDFIEFDVQVTKDGCPIIFHDDFILSEQQGVIFEKRVTDLTLTEFLSYGPQKDTTTKSPPAKPLLRKTKDGKIHTWNVETDDSLCTLQQAFDQIHPITLGFNIELKFDDHFPYQTSDLTASLLSILQVVSSSNSTRPIIFSSFHPDAALLMRKLQQTYPVLFLTNGGQNHHADVRRNNLKEALKVSVEGGLQGIVSEARGVFKHPGVVRDIKQEKLALLTYGELNNVAEAVYMQHLMGVDGVIVDFVKEITEAVSNYNLTKPKEGVDYQHHDETSCSSEGDHILQVSGKELAPKPDFSDKELSFLLKLIPQLIQQ